MTELKGEAHVERKTQLEYKGRMLVATLHPRFVNIREFKRPDKGVNVSYDAVYELGLKKRAQIEAEEKRNG